MRTTSEVIIAAIAAAAGSVITVVGKVIVDIIRANKEPNESDLMLKDELEREKEKNKAAIDTFNNVAQNLSSSMDEMKDSIETLKTDIEEYRKETREISRSELRHSITQIYFENCDRKTLDLRTKDDLCSLYEAYSRIGGNSFAHELYEEMMQWSVR